MTLVFNDVADCILTHLSLTNIYNQEQFLIKNNIIFSSSTGTEACDTIDVFFTLKNIKNYMFEILYNKSLDLVKEKIGSVPIKNLDCSLLSEFQLPVDSFRFSGNHVLLFFSTPLISNPLNVITIISSKLKLSLKYNSIRVDYILFKGKIVYYFIFSYSDTLSNHFKELKSFILNFLQTDYGVVNGSNYPEVQELFQIKHLKQYDEFNNNVSISFEGCSVSTPHIHIDKSVSEINEFKKSLTAEI